jgi:hypothetical protein
MVPPMNNKINKMRLTTDIAVLPLPSCGGTGGVLVAYFGGAKLHLLSCCCGLHTHTHSHRGDGGDGSGHSHSLVLYNH